MQCEEIGAEINYAEAENALRLSVRQLAFYVMASWQCYGFTVCYCVAEVKTRCTRQSRQPINMIYQLKPDPPLPSVTQQGVCRENVTHVFLLYIKTVLYMKTYIAILGGRITL